MIKLKTTIDILVKDRTINDAEIKVLSKQLANTETAFNDTVDKLIRRIENLEHFRDDLLEKPEKNVFDSLRKKKLEES